MKFRKGVLGIPLSAHSGANLTSGQGFEMTHGLKCSAAFSKFRIQFGNVFTNIGL